VASANVKVMGLPGKTVWQLQLLVGVITTAFGIILTAHPSGALSVVAIFIGIALILGGVANFVRALDHEEQHRAWTVTAGIVEVVVGIVMIRHLSLSFAVIGLLIGISWIVQGIAALLLGMLGGSRGHRAWPITFGFISLAAGIVTVAVPEKSVTTIATLIGIWFIVLGLVEVIGGFILRKQLASS